MEADFGNLWLEGQIHLLRDGAVSRGTMWVCWVVENSRNEGLTTGGWLYRIQEHMLGGSLV